MMEDSKEVGGRGGWHEAASSFLMGEAMGGPGAGESHSQELSLRCLINLADVNAVGM